MDTIGAGHICSAARTLLRALRLRQVVECRNSPKRDLGNGNTIGRRLARTYPATNGNLVPVLRDFREFFIGAQGTTAYQVVWGAVGFVLLIACGNVAILVSPAGDEEIALIVQSDLPLVRADRESLAKS